jgi:predicted metal-dependent phosphoesterase TrpH
MGTKEWFKGNLHTYTTKSDGDETPEKVCEWFEKHEYDFLVLSDHNHLTSLDYESTGNSTLKMIPGEEVTAFASSNMAPVHIGG